MKKLFFLLGLVFWVFEGFGQNETSDFWIFEAESNIFSSAKQADENKHLSNRVLRKLNLFSPDKKTTPSTEDHVFIDFVGTGDLQQSISKDDELKGNTGLGVIFERITKEQDKYESFEVESFINIASTSDTIEGTLAGTDVENMRAFGNYILNPVSRKRSLFINSNFYLKGDSSEPFYAWKNLVSGFHCRIIASSNVWTLTDEQNISTSSNLGAFSSRIGIFHEIVPFNYRMKKNTENGDPLRRDISIFLGINYTRRRIFGDITNEKNKAIREMILGQNAKKTYSGMEFNFGFRLNNIRAEFQMPILFNGKDLSSVDGLTNTQFLFSIKFVGGFELKLNKKQSD